MNRNLADFLTAFIIVFFIQVIIMLYFPIALLSGLLGPIGPLLFSVIQIALVFLAVRHYKICQREVPK